MDTLLYIRTCAQSCRVKTVLYRCSADCRAAGANIRSEEERNKGRSVALRVLNRGEGAGLHGGCVFKWNTVIGRNTIRGRSCADQMETQVTTHTHNKPNTHLITSYQLTHHMQIHMPECKQTQLPATTHTLFPQLRQIEAVTTLRLSATTTFLLICSRNTELHLYFLRLSLV